MQNRLLRCSQPPSWYGWVMSLGGQAVWSPHPRFSCPNCLSFVAVLRFSVGITIWNSTKSFWRWWDRGRGEERRDEKLVFFILTDIIGCSLVPGEVCWGGRRGSLARERPSERGGRGAFTSGAAAGTLLWTDGLQHPAFPLFQHMFLGRPKGRVRKNATDPPKSPLEDLRLQIIHECPLQCQKWSSKPEQGHSHDSGQFPPSSGLCYTTCLRVPACYPQSPNPWLLCQRNS